MISESERALLKAQEASGKSIAAYSREQGIPDHQLYALKKRMSRENRQSASGNFIRIGGASMCEVQLKGEVVVKFPASELAVVLGALK